MTGSTISSTSAAITSPPASIEPPGPKPSKPGPRSPAWPLGHKPSCDRPSCALSRPEPIKLTVPFRMLSVAGDNVTKRIRREPDPVIARIVAGWPRRFDARSARELGFTAEDSFEEIIRIHIEDELGGRFTA